MRIDGFGQLEAKIMDHMWSRGRSAPVTVRDVLVELSAERDIAYTTVMSTMDNLHTKGWLGRERHSRAYRYQATMTREEHSAHLMSAVLAGGGRPDLVLKYFVEQMDNDESATIRRALRRVSRSRQ
ncbi:BlaI/MecI/CopY family transcriptional regulator [Mycolicibacterium frederiksbergense]|uniref:BlaI/MecI/CopY family transcriptional regulator n=1 Tax=Mycolicibacterium frederiksbergense TaxID=117567 RepID=A0A6H0RX61_9MYCO|nr:BlaI/MecI/CopY family transcriptional regulator [Mycolicibacterium frederiksbergense]QIV79708.1 BlaI/MecI/CopY family transcriptional regulator [Mycolicibacterium frederiksbergense]